MKTHYDTLNLGKSCSEKEIKDSFIKLSKKFHPDLNKSSDAHKRFVEINEAYSVLGNTSSRLRYDATLSAPRTFQQTEFRNDSYASRRAASHNMNSYEYYANMYAAQRNRYKDTGTSYITTSKVRAFVLCCVLMMFGSALQVSADSRRRLVRSQRYARAVKEAREKQSQMGFEEMLRERTKK